MSVIKLLAGPLIGAVIGYCTNYIAIKMLFRPRKAYYIGKFHIPFTPGIIPKEKDRIGKAIGEAVGETLLTEEDIEHTLLSDEMKAMVCDGVYGGASSLAECEESFQDFMFRYITEENYCRYYMKVEDKITDKMVDAVQSFDFGAFISKEANRVVQEKMQGSMLGMFLDASTIQSFIDPIGERVDTYVSEHGEEMIRPMVDSQMNELQDRTLASLLHKEKWDEERIYGMIEQVYVSCVKRYAKNIIQRVNISGMIEDKVAQMDVMEVERLVLSVMDKELKAIVNLGALIGLVLGIFNLLF